MHAARHDDDNDDDDGMKLNHHLKKKCFVFLFVFTRTVNRSFEMINFGKHEKNSMEIYVSMEIAELVLNDSLLNQKLLFRKKNWFHNRFFF